MEETWIDCGETRLHVITEGPAGGPPVILLHGFPEFWRGWIRQIPALAKAGYRVIVPDQRGYNLSSKPRGVMSYGARQLVGDVLGLIDRLGYDRVGLAGHDWGAAVAWSTALWHPERVRKLAVLNVPHPSVMLRFLSRSPAQMARSWYIGFFQLPWLPELLLKAGRFKAAKFAVRGASRPGTFSDADMAHYEAAWSQPGALTSMVHWYRALLWSRPPLPPDPRITVETLILWGCLDKVLGHEMVQPSLDLCDRGRAVFFENATHWVQHEEAAEISRCLIEFFSP
jgi:epoxide hydrolase 4